MSRLGNRPSEPPLVLSLVDTGRSTMRMLFEVWRALWHESHQ